MMIFRVLVLLMIPLSQAWAGDVQPPEVSTAYMGKMLFSLVLVVAFLFAFMWLMRRSMQLGGSADGIRIVAVKALGTRERLMVVDVGGEQILLAVTPQRIEKLHELKAPLEIQPAAVAKADFPDMFRTLLSTKKPDKDGE